MEATPDQHAWNLFYRDIVARVQGGDRVAYPTFRNGWEAMALFDASRAAHD
ncbi:MAG TPA: hypothetical protein PKA05_11400 [Roseiflexaceae bacterium]|nr:hypothetical protein [Roseiflexaceae bacterium]HMP40978.1 hypothetical protein [Roseiflexaceae bacterium]